MESHLQLFSRKDSGRDPIPILFEVFQTVSILFRQRESSSSPTGLSGVGKTQLVLELAHRAVERYKDTSVIWIPTASPRSLHQSYRDVAQELHIPGWEDDKADIKKLVQEYLSKKSVGPWLLVIDNADDINLWTAKPKWENGSSQLIEYLPRNRRGSIIFTTRDRKTVSGCQR